MRVAAVLAILLGTASAALAADGFELIIPGRPGVPIIINGIDVSYAVVEGDWGLAKNVQVQPTIYGGRYVGDVPPNVGHYYPSLGHTPGYGRLEIEPPANRKLPKPPESYYRSWSSQSAPLPPDVDVPLDPPPVIVAPPDRNGEQESAAPRPPNQNFQQPKPKKLPN